jgi:hypothetical protein
MRFQWKASRNVMGHCYLRYHSEERDKSSVRIDYGDTRYKIRDVRTGGAVILSSYSGNPVSGEYKLVTYERWDTCNL